AHAESQSAKVYDNNDPEGMGRIRVLFYWGAGGYNVTDWVRMVQPHSGAGKGFHFIPEIGEEVLVGFEGGNAEKPYVIGTHYNGKQSSGFHTPGNDLKVFKTRSGIENRSNDAERSWQQSTPDGNFLQFDGQGNAILNVPQKLTINATNVEINAFNNVEANVSNNMILNIMSQFFIFTPFLKQVVSGFMNLFSGKALINSKETIHIEAEEVTTHGTKKMLVHSDKLTTINSMEVAEMHGSTKNSFTNKPTKQKKKAVDKITNTLVEFRTKQDGSYIGQFGFDWLRIDDNAATTEKKYEDCLVNGYEAPNGKAPHRDANTEFEAGEAFPELEKMYRQIPIKRASTPALTKYYIPYLNLYPEAIHAAYTTTPQTTPQPPCEAELRVLVDVEIEEPDQIRIVFNKKYFTIDGLDGTDANPVLITDKAVGVKRDIGTNITIKCIAEFSNTQEIIVYAYPKDSLTKSTAEQLTLRKVVGKILVSPNKNTPASKGKRAVRNRKTQKFVFVQVRTNLTGTVETGAFNKIDALGEKDNLQNALHQALIHGEFEDGPILDLTLEPDFLAGGKYDSGGTFNEDYGKIIGTPVYDKIPHFFRDMKKIFLNRPGNSKYNNHFTVFVIEDPVYDDAKGQIEGEEYIEGGVTKTKFFKNLILFKNRDTCTLNHEGLHGLGLFHTHADGTIYSSNQKFVFVSSDTDITKSTDNVMSYRTIAYTTWHWQWGVIRKKAN
ncbi:MAG TPA: phage baseplate assembly protein V, partial [Flavobacterium sp.]